MEKVIINLDKYNDLLQKEEILESDKDVVLVKTFDGYIESKIYVTPGKTDELEESIKSVMDDYAESLSIRHDEDDKRSWFDTFISVFRV